MSKKFIGHCTCPECSFDEAEIKTTKNQLAYRWCPECHAQYFPRCKATSDRLIAKCHTTAEEETPAPAPVVAAVPIQVPAAVPVKQAPKLVAVPKPKKSGPFDFLLNKEGAPA